MAIAYDNGQIVFSSPIFGGSSADGDGGTPGPVKTANPNYDGTGDLNKLLTAGANGAHARRARFVAAGENAQSVARFFVFDGASAWRFVHEVTLPATVADDDVARGPVVVPLDFMLPAAHELHFTIGSDVVGGWFGSAEGMDCA